MNELIRICDVEKYYGNGNNITKAVNRKYYFGNIP